MSNFMQHSHKMVEHQMRALYKANDAMEAAYVLGGGVFGKDYLILNVAQK